MIWLWIYAWYFIVVADMTDIIFNIICAVYYCAIIVILWNYCLIIVIYFLCMFLLYCSYYWMFAVLCKVPKAAASTGDWAQDLHFARLTLYHWAIEAWQVSFILLCILILLISLVLLILLLILLWALLLYCWYHW